MNYDELLSGYEGLVFDLDGTLVDLGTDWEALKGDLEKYYYRKTKQQIRFSPLDKKLLLAKKSYGEGLYTELLKIVSKYEIREEKYMPNQELIDYINGSNKKFAIYSMNTRACIDFCVKKYLKVQPSIVISKETCSKPKPTEKDLLHVLTQWGLNKKEVIFVGNTKGDLDSGCKSGVKTVII